MSRGKFRYEWTPFVAAPKHTINNEHLVCCTQAGNLHLCRFEKVFYRLCSRVPARRKTNMIASAMLNETMGRLLPTKGNEASHHTWWVALDANPCEKFSILEVLECVSE